MCEWSKLPKDPLCEIALKLDSAEDLVCFFVVCSSWHDAYSMVKKKWTPRMPWLMLAENTKNNPNHLRKLFCPSRQKCYNLKLPQTFGARCWGTSSGWVVTSDLNLELHLFNPISGAQIRLPPPPSYEYIHEYDIDCRRLHLAEKVIVFEGDEYDHSDCLIMAIYDDALGRVAYIRPKEEAWTLVTTPKIDNNYKCSAYDFVRCGSQILILYGTGGVGYFDLIEPEDSRQPVTAKEFVPEHSELLDPLHQGLHELYLLEVNGDLLLLLRYRQRVMDQWDPPQFNGEIFYETIDFEVYKLNFDTKTWEEIRDMGDVALFVGNNCSMFVRASSSNNCKPNCIYFTDDEMQFWSSPKDYGGHDMGIFHLETEEIEKGYEGDDMRSNFCPPLWFMPKF